MSLAQYQSHPVRQMIRHAAYCGEAAVPTRHEIDRLDLPPALRKRVADACREVAKIHDTGLQSEAWSRGDDHCFAIIGDLSEEQQDPRWFDGPSATDLIEHDPDALATHVPRKGVTR
jgi:hypothetical protein